MAVLLDLEAPHKSAIKSKYSLKPSKDLNLNFKLPKQSQDKCEATYNGELNRFSSSTQKNYFFI